MQAWAAFIRPRFKTIRPTTRIQAIDFYHDFFRFHPYLRKHLLRSGDLLPMCGKGFSCNSPVSASLNTRMQYEAISAPFLYCSFIQLMASVLILTGISDKELAYKSMK